MAMSFMVTGGSSDLPYDVFGIGILPKPLTNGNWTWLGQAYPCETNIIYGLTNRDVFLVLGTPTSFDGDGLTAAFDSLVLHIDPMILTLAEMALPMASSCWLDCR